MPTCDGLRKKRRRKKSEAKANARAAASAVDPGLDGRRGLVRRPSLAPLKVLARAPPPNIMAQGQECELAGMLRRQSSLVDHLGRGHRSSRAQSVAERRTVAAAFWPRRGVAEPPSRHSPSIQFAKEMVLAESTLGPTCLQPVSLHDDDYSLAIDASCVDLPSTCTRWWLSTKPIGLDGRASRLEGELS